MLVWNLRLVYVYAKNKQTQMQKIKKNQFQILN